MYNSVFICQLAEDYYKGAKIYGILLNPKPKGSPRVGIHSASDLNWSIFNGVII